MYCSDCGMPKGIGKANIWKPSGVIVDNARGMAAVMKLLVEELGEDVEHTLAEISRDYARDYYLGLEGQPAMEDEFARLALWGWGLPSRLNGSNGDYRLQVINPFYGPIMAGRVWGLAEASGGSTFDLDACSHDEGVIIVGLSER